MKLTNVLLFDNETAVEIPTSIKGGTRIEYHWVTILQLIDDFPCHGAWLDDLNRTIGPRLFDNYGAYLISEVVNERCIFGY
jgi:hypothetical protein